MSNDVREQPKKAKKPEPGAKRTRSGPADTLSCPH